MDRTAPSEKDTDTGTLEKHPWAVARQPVFEAEQKWWAKPGYESKRKENEFAWRVSLADIAARGYNLDVKNPHTVDDAHCDPAELLAEYQKPQAAVDEVGEKLRKELAEALNR